MLRDALDKLWDRPYEARVFTLQLLQGLAELINRFRDSPVAREDPDLQPTIIHPPTGRRASFAQVNAALFRRFGRGPVPPAAIVDLTMEAVAMPDLSRLVSPNISPAPRWPTTTAVGWSLS